MFLSSPTPLLVAHICYASTTWGFFITLNKHTSLGSRARWFHLQVWTAIVSICSGSEIYSLTYFFDILQC